MGLGGSPLSGEVRVRFFINPDGTVQYSSYATTESFGLTAGTLPTHGSLFVTLLIGTVLLVGLLNYVPSLALGPMVVHLMLRVQ